MPTRSLYRTATAKGFATPTTSPIYVDSDDNILKVIPAGSGTTEVQVVDASSTQTLTNKTLTAPVLTSPVVNNAMVAGGASLSLTTAAHDGRTIALDTAAGTTITLPAASGSGATFKLVVTVAATSNQHRVSVTGNDTFFGQIISGNDTDNTVVAFPAGAGVNQINWNGTSTGGTKGAILELIDMVADSWAVQGITDASGTEATPFATV